MTLYKGTQLIAQSGGYHPPLLSCQWSDHLLNDIQWLRADTFSWQSGSVYTTAYNHLVSDISGITSETETIGSYTVTFYRATDGHKICLADQETTVLNIYNETGIAWYYILDTTNQRFKLPRTKWGVKGLRGNVGDDIAESLPNITGTSGNANWFTNSGASEKANPTGSFYLTNTEDSTTIYSGNNTLRSHFGFDASRSSSTYQDDAPVQERATQMYLYFYVGEYTQTAIEQTAGLNSELFNGKADISSFVEVNPMIESYVDGTSGYNIWANGYCEQWGYATSGTYATRVTITLAKSFSSSDYTIMLSAKGAHVTDSAMWASKTATDFQIYGGYNGGNQVAVNTCWKACGYLADSEMENL